MTQVNIPSIKLADGRDFPLVGLGTFRATNKDVFKASIKHALKVGYRHFDCAWLYGNEAIIGEAIQEAIGESNGQLKRQDLFLVSKVWNTHHSRDLVRRCLDETLKNLQTNYIDLYLVHWPMGFKENTGMEPFPKDADGKMLYSEVHYLETYRAMEELAKEGKIKSLGVSNFNIRQLKEVLDSCEIKPVNNQVEVNPYFQNSKLIDFCQANGVVVSAFGPIGGGQESYSKKPDLKVILQNQVLVDIGKKYNKSPAQVAIRWGVQRNLVMLPKSTTESRILENAQVFDFTLSDEDMASIKALDQNLRVYAVENLNNHKYFPFFED